MSFQRMILFLLVLMALPGLLPAQDITGLWTGYIESAGSRIPYEVVISANGDKWNGYALTAFTFNETENIGIKTIELKEKKGALSLEDHDLVYDNYKTPPRRIKMIASLVVRGRDSTMVLEGSFFTRSLDFRSQDKAAFTGIIHLNKKKNDEITKLTSKLDEMNLLASLSFASSLPPKGSLAGTRPADTIASTGVNNKKPVSTSPSAAMEKESTEITVNSNPSSRETEAIEQLPSPKERSTIQRSQATAAPKTTFKPGNNQPVQKTLVKAPQPALAEAHPGTSSDRTLPQKEQTVATPVQSMPAQKQPSPSPKNTDVAQVAPTRVARPKEDSKHDQPAAKELVKQMPAPARKPEPALVPPPAAAIANRKTEVIQNIYFTSDSLVLSIYDNGTIDGDTVSVVLNGQVILARKGLTANAIRTTIPVTPAMGDSLQLVMYAENLGSIPPNTGLLIVQDGDQRYDIRFAGDMKKSSAVILRRRR